MIDAKDFSRAIEKLSQLLTTHLPAINEKMALDGSAMVKDRILNTGKKADGQDLGSYSTNELPAFFFAGKELNKSGEAFYLSKKSKGEGISYKDWKEANNRPTDFVNLSFSGTTMRDIGVIKQITEGAKITTAVGPRNTVVRANGDTTEKITDEYLGPKYGNFIEPNPEERKKLGSYLSNEVEKLINDSFK